MKLRSPDAESNIFDFVRLALAFMVIVTHSYAVLGMPEHDLLHQSTNGQLRFSVFAVNSFFVISGYLVTKSLLRSANIAHYMAKRLLRIMPAFWAAVLISILLLGLFVADDAYVFFTSHETCNYLLNTLLLRIHYHISDVFSGKTINGSLWTIPYELFCYVFIVPFISWPFLKKKLIVVLPLFAVCLTITLSEPDLLSGGSLPVVWLSYHEICRLVTLFLGGSVLSFVNLADNRLRLILLGLTGTGIVASLSLEVYRFTEFILLPIFVVCLGLIRCKVLSAVTAKGDFSYGIYLWAFPIQQTFFYFIDFAEPQLLTLLTIPTAYLFGVLSWYLVERPSLKLKCMFPILLVDGTSNEKDLRTF